MTLPNCAPSYGYIPTFVSEDVQCTAPGYAEARARLFILDSTYILPPDINGLFFRSKQFSDTCNQIAVENNGTLFQIFKDDVIIRSYPVLSGSGSIADLRSKLEGLNSIPYNIPDPDIEMTPMFPIGNYDINDNIRTIEDDTIGLFVFDKMLLTGGSGPPIDDSVLPSIRTGPERSLIIITTSEDIHGNITQPPVSRKVQQWNGNEWISYCNLVPGECPLEGTC